MSADMKIEDRIDWLTKQVRVLHEKTGSHEWTKDFRPWNENKDKRHKCTPYCDHHIHYIECLCGESRKATAEEFEAAQRKYDGHY